MTARATKAPTADATVRFRPGHERALALGGPGWLKTLRQAGFARFAEAGLPAGHDEEWRHTPSALLTQPVWADAPAADGAEALARQALERVPDTGGRRLVFVDGRPVASLARRSGLPEGIVIATLGEALARDAATLEPLLGRVAEIERHPYAALNTGCLTDGAVIRVGDGVVVERPIQVVFVATGGAGSRATWPRLLVVAGARACVRVVEHHVAVGDGAVLADAVAELVAGAGAELTHVAVAESRGGSALVSLVAARAERDARLRLHALDAGAGFVRRDTMARLTAEGAEATLDGLTLVSGEGVADNHTTVDHAAPHGSSREVWKVVVADQARAVFNGRIAIRAGAQSTDASQVNKNLLLSDRAGVHTTPQLEILANDVKCAHGAAIGQLDADALFYLRARGLPPAEARRLLTTAFVADVRNRLPEALHALADATLTGMLDRVVEVAR